MSPRLSAGSKNGSNGKAQPEPILAVRDLDASYGPVQILFGLDLDIYEGEIVALLGTNGAGKSTLFKCITNLLEPTRGSVTFAGEDLTGMPTDEIAGKGVVMMPGGKSVFPTLSVRENLRLACWLKRKDHAAVREAEERVLDLFPRLGDRIDQMAGNLSGGEQQMLAVGRAMMGRPKLLLLDEPSMGLAPVMVLRLFDLIRRVRAEGYTILVVEQNVRQVLKLVDRAYLLEVGRIHMEGRADELADQDFVRKAYVGL
jgi:branched-chain amino acid transport system ATP-binding protein